MIKRFLYRSYRFFYRYEQWRRRRFTVPGLVLSGMVVIVGIIGLDTHISLVHQLAAWLVSALALSYVWTLLSPRVPFRIKRRLPKYATVGEPFVYYMDVENPTQKRWAELSFFENQDDPRPTMQTLLNAREPGEEKRNFWDRKILYYRWMWLISKKRILDDAQHPLPEMPAGHKTRTPVRAVPRNRGYLHFTGIDIARTEPLGLLRATRTVAAPEKMLVLPRRYHLPPLDLPGARRHHARGVRMALSIGNQDEFVSLRDYRPGDALRQIHWKSTAKKNEPVIKEYQDEFFVRHALILDTFMDVAYSDLFEEAVSVAASCVCTMQTQESLLDLIFVGDQAYRFSSGRGTASCEHMLGTLAAVHICRDKPFDAIAAPVMAQVSRYSGCICVLLDWDDARKALVRDLKSIGVPLVVMVVVADRHKAPLDPGPMAGYESRFFVLRCGHIEKDLSGR